MRLDALAQQWPAPNPSTLEHLSKTIAPLMRLAPLAGLDELQFRIWCERLTVGWLKGDADEQVTVRERIQGAVASLADTIPEVQRAAEQRAWVCSSGFWQHLDMVRLTTLQTVFAPLMRYRTSTPGHTVRNQSSRQHHPAQLDHYRPHRRRSLCRKLPPTG